MAAVRPLVTLLVAAVVGIVALGLGTPAFSGTVTATRISAEFSDTRSVYRETFSIVGAVQYHDGSSYVEVPPGNGAVTLLRRMAGSDTWDTIETDADGASFSFSATALGNADYEIRFEGNETYSSSVGSNAVSVERRMNDRVTDAPLTLRGKVQPSWQDKVVVVQVRKNGVWGKLDVVRTDSRSRWAKKLYTLPGGKRTYFRAYVRGTTEFVRSYTSTYYTFLVQRVATTRIAR